MTEHRDHQRSQADSESFTRDVFLSHSSHDTDVVRELAERLRGDGVRVWPKELHSEWEIKLGDSVPKKIDDGVEQSRVLVLCMSEHAFASDWATLESQTFRFRDPLNRQRRFIPLRLDNTPEQRRSLRDASPLDVVALLGMDYRQVVWRSTFFFDSTERFE